MLPQFSSSGRALFTSHEKGCLCVWDPITVGWTHKIKVVKNETDDLLTKLTPLTLSPDGESLAMGCHDGTVRILAATGNAKQNP